MSRTSKPVLDFDRNTYIATVTCRSCPGYTAPAYGQGGHRTGRSYGRGEAVEVIMIQDCDTYVSALTADNVWINVWCLHNLQGQPVGVYFCTLAARPRDPA